MDSLWFALEQTTTTNNPPELLVICLTLLLAFILGQVIAWVYCWSHGSLSYSRSFTQSLVLLTIIVALVMLVIGNNIVTAFGLIGALAIIRFRNVLKDTRDTVYIFTGLVIGMAVGSQRYATAIVGLLAIVLVILYLKISNFGTMGRFDGFLHCRIPAGSSDHPELHAVLKRFCRSVKRVSMRESAGDPMTDLTFQIRLRDTERGHELVSELESLRDLNDVSLIVQQEMSEV